MFEDIELWQGDCLELMKYIPDEYIDCIITDLPYGMTKCSWDTVIPFDKLWKCYNRVIKDNGAILLFSMQPFTSLLVASNLKMFRYEWIWRKTKQRGHLNAKKMPLRVHENIEVIYKKPTVYNPQMTCGPRRVIKKTKYRVKENGIKCYGTENRDTCYDSAERYPLDVQVFANEIPLSERIHNTQKPAELYEYFIRTYTNENDLVLDSCAGSMTCAVAAINTGRKCICIEKDKEMFGKGYERVMKYVENDPWSNQDGGVL